MDFLGLQPPELDVPLVELETLDGEIVDLHNGCDLRRVVLDARGLTFEFTRIDFGCVTVLFRDIRILRVEQPPDWAPEESDLFEDLLIRVEGPWPRVVVKAGGLEYEFDCGAVCLALEGD